VKGATRQREPVKHSDRIWGDGCVVGMDKCRAIVGAARGLYGRVLGGV
jgi:hypothetical protein